MMSRVRTARQAQEAAIGTPNPFGDWLRERSVWQIGFSYLVSAWLVLEVTDTLSGVAGLPIWVPRLVLALLIVGLFLVLATAVVQRSVRLSPRSRLEGGRLRSLLTWSNLTKAGIVAFAVIGLAATAAFVGDRFGPLSADAPGRRGVRWATNVALPEILQEVEAGNLGRAFALAQMAERHIPDHPVVQRTLKEVARYTSLRTEPAGALVEIAPYESPEGAWQSLGRTPLDAVRIPVGFFRWRISLPGYDTLLTASAGLQFPTPTLHSGHALTPVGAGRNGMVRIPEAEVGLGIPDLFHHARVSLPEFWLDRYEVTNEEYRAFVDDGGYDDPAHWVESFHDDGEARVTFSQAMSRFVDRTGRPGPSTWIGGVYPDGRASHPVGGISWYEAAAFARWAGKALPTLYHWHRASGADMAAHLLTKSNFSGVEPAPVGAYQGVGPFGTFDMAGNVKEWVHNEAAGGRRYIAGGAWDEPAYLFREAESRSPWDRSPNNGVRLMVSAAPTPPGSRAPLPPGDGIGAPRKVSDEVWAAYAALYEYGRSELDASSEHVEESERWVRETVSYRAAYGSERIRALFYRPTTSLPPYRPVVVFPGSDALDGGRLEESSHPLIELLVKAGRAVFLPTYQGTYERAHGLTDDNPTPTVEYRDHVVMWSKDLGRSLDYLESRPDVDASSVGYLGVSWGAGLGPLLAAVEPRLTALVLVGGGFWNSATRPEVDQRVFAPRSTAPTLMVNGRSDPFFPFESAQLPMYHALGTEGEAKRHVVFDAGHSVPLLEAGREALAWFDRYLGTAERGSP